MISFGIFDRPEAYRSLCLLLILLAAPVQTCGSEPAPTEAADLETHLTLKNASGKESTTFRAGEPLTLVVTIRNESDAIRTLALPSSQTCDFVISGPAGKEIWRWSAGRMFAQMLTEVTLGAGESREFVATWDQTTKDRPSLAPGEYQAVGMVPVKAPGTRSEPIRFTVR